MIQQKEQAVRHWFAMWLAGRAEGLEELFAPDAVYIESWGPEYHGLEKIRHWFAEWNTRGRVEEWQILQFFHQGEESLVRWLFRDRMEDGRTEAFEGLSLIRWREGKIAFLQEFGCSLCRYDPYAAGPEPRFDGQQTRWF